MQTKIRLGIFFGGQSPEHEVSIRSAQSVIDHLDSEKYEVFPIKIDKNGVWQKECFSPGALRDAFDVVFPMLHGPYGEDGTVQGLLELANVPYVGSDHLSSAICMDKGVTKALLCNAGLPTPCHQLLRAGDPINVTAFPLFVKPTQMGSSVGISKVSHPDDLSRAVEEAFKYSEMILIEESIEGKEIECSVLGNADPIASLPGEIIPTHEFYSYEAKYLDDNGAHFILPADLSPEKIEEVQHLAIAAFKTLRCEGMARVDFFLKNDGTLLVSELNTIPGFTSISLYPKLWESSGIPYSELLDRLIELAFERHRRKKPTSPLLAYAAK